MTNHRRERQCGEDWFAINKNLYTDNASLLHSRILYTEKLMINGNGLVVDMVTTKQALEYQLPVLNVINASNVQNMTLKQTCIMLLLFSWIYIATGLNQLIRYLAHTSWTENAIVLNNPFNCFFVSPL